ncbi:YhbY family RNA-binding protein [Granulosicoccus antarcticus]|uniref:RNA-binding protein n=1 Tax=Granulosicoccus antarcticus IMCC3135 TaxID=1192854 RepID=A0A2Z2NX30_9GAMM|nr:YhbY family RNA-binding protein [Granulosicoccus antarcticus]ASJ72297.1 RNA-binding protein [Granulosicoccus antarcticus IMCC3135]
MNKKRELDKAALKYLRSLAHALKPVVRLGQHGLTEAVTKELDGALSHHELVKVKLSESEKEARLNQLNLLCQSVRAISVQQIGHTATLYRRNDKKPVIDLSLAKR